MEYKGNQEHAIDRIKQSIARKGFHTYVVTGGGDPHYAYTIGLLETLGAELIFAGAYFYMLEDIPQIVEKAVARLTSSSELDGQTIPLGSWGSFALGTVDESWVKLLMLGAVDFYKSKMVRAFQILPDKAHETLDIPKMNRPWSPVLEPAWGGVQRKWPYAVPVQSVAITNLNALHGERITEIMRWEEDEWEMFAGAGPDISQEDRRVVPLSVLLATDESLLTAVNLKVGSGLWRDDSSTWHPWGASAEANS